MTEPSPDELEALTARVADALVERAFDLTIQQGHTRSTDTEEI